MYAHKSSGYNARYAGVACAGLAVNGQSYDKQMNRRPLRGVFVHSYCYAIPPRIELRQGVSW